MKYLSIVIVALLTASCLGIASESSSESFNFTVESSENMEISDFNNIIKSAVADGEKWPFSPALITFKVLGDDQETQKLSLKQEANSIENPNIMTSVLVRDGFLDDSVRGDWHQLTFIKETDNSWRIKEIKKAFRCWRQDSNIYKAGVCQ